MVVTPFGRQSQTGWPRTPLDSLSPRKVCSEKAESRQLPLQRPCQLPTLLPTCQGSGWSACCLPAAAAAFFFRHAGPSFRGLPATFLRHCLLYFAKLTSNSSSLNLEVPPGSLPLFCHDSPLLGLMTSCPLRGFCVSCVTALITQGCQCLFACPSAPLTRGLCEGRSHSAVAPTSP